MNTSRYFLLHDRKKCVDRIHKFERVLDPKTDELEIKETQSASCNIRDTHLKMKRKRD